MSQEIRDMLTQQQTSYMWEAYLAHRKAQKKLNHALHSQEKAKPTQAPRPSGEALGDGHNKCCTKKGK